MIITGLLVGLVVLIGLGVVGLGLLVLWGCAGNLWQRWAAFVGALRSRSWAETSGTVTRSVVQHRRYRRHVNYAAAIRYSYTVGDKAFVAERVDFVEQEGTFEAARAMVERYPVGSSQRVYYSPVAPGSATLERNLPSGLVLSLAWLVVALVGLALVWLGGDIVFGAFDEPPELGELPALQAQLGGLLVGGGVVALMVAGVRALLERKTRRMLRYCAEAKPVQARDVRAGERVAVLGRAEEDTEGGDDVDDVDDADNVAEPDEGEAGEPGEANALERALGEGALFYLHTDLGSADGDLAQVSPFVVRDETGEVKVELSQGQGLLGSQQVQIGGGLERWLDQHDLELGSSVSAERRTAMKIERIREGDSVLIVGRALRLGASRVVIRATKDEPLSLLFADKPLADVITELRRKPRTTLALCAAGGVSIVVGAIALLA